MDSDHGGWLGLTIGSSAFRRSSRPAAVVATGLWLLRGDKTMFASIDRSFVGDTAYSDLRASGRWRRDRIVLEGIVGARVWSRGGGRGVFGEGSVILNLAAGAALVLSAGRYPTDAISGSIAGRYATLAVRLGTIPFRRAPTPTFRRPRSSAADDPEPSLDQPLLAIRKQRGDDVQLTLYATGVRNAFDLQGVSYARKVREAVMAVKINQKYSKDEVMGFYLNTVYFGRGCYGIEAAAEAYFGKHASELTVAEGMVLASVIKQPEGTDGFDPGKNLANAQDRWNNYVRPNMVKLGFLKPEAAAALTYPTNIIKPDSSSTGAAQFGKDTPTGFVVHHVMDHVIEDLVSRCP